MSLLTILHYPDPRLRTKASDVTEFSPQLDRFAQDLLETMYEAPGIGLAATQVNVHKRVIAVDVSEDKSAPHLLVNPKITLLTEPDVFGEEGCLSVPGIYDQVARASAISVEAQKTNGDHFTFEAEGLLAVCIQHECDHLLGKLFVDYLSTLKRNRIRKKLVKQQKQRA